jgi:hypothetical protein
MCSIPINQANSKIEGKRFCKHHNLLLLDLMALARKEDRCGETIDKG